MLSRIEVDPIWSRVVHHFPIHTRNETGVGGTLSLYVAEMTDTKIVFNGDTASGRAQWVPWLRSLRRACPPGVQPGGGGSLLALDAGGIWMGKRRASRSSRAMRSAISCLADNADRT